MNKEPTAAESSSLLFEGMICLRALVEGTGSSFNDRRIEKVLYAKERLEKHPKEYAFLCHRAKEQNFQLIFSDRQILDSLAPDRSHGGILAFCTERNFPRFSEDFLVKQGFYMAMEGIEDPYNFGYALRSVYAAGVDGVILSGGVRTGADGIVCRSSAGAFERMPIYTASKEFTGIFRKAGYRVICADLPDSKPVYDANLKKPLLLVIGGEKRGISRELLQSCDEIVRLDYGRPFDAALSSASAASILAFEVFRQNR